MSSYYPSFNYMGLNSFKDKNLLVVHFESGDKDEHDTFLSMDPIYTESAYGTRRIDYGAKYNAVAVIRISVIKSNGKEFSVAEVRDFLKWTTGSRQNSYLDLVDGEVVKASFLGRVTAVYQQKIDARTVGFVIEHTSVSPWAYSSKQFVSCYFGQDLSIDPSSVLYANEYTLNMSDGVLSNGTHSTFDIANDGTVYVDNSINVRIDNLSDDLFSYVYLDTVFTNKNSNEVIIKNLTLGEETKITSISRGETIKLSSEQFIISDVPTKIFGNSFNFTWPRLAPGVNDITVSGDGEGGVEFVYRYPIKIGDCAIDIDVSGASINCGNCPDNSIGSSTSGPVTWDEILEKPSTIEGYGITDAYTMVEVNKKISDVDVDIAQEDLNRILTETFG